MLQTGTVRLARFAKIRSIEHSVMSPPQMFTVAFGPAQ